MAENNITVIWAAYYSPDYNAIEFVFSKIKGKVRKLRLQDFVDNKSKTYQQYITAAVKNTTHQDINNCINHVYKLFEINK